MMYKGLGVLMLAMVVSTPAVAEKSSVLETLINTQTRRFHEAYNLYAEACAEVKKDDRGMKLIIDANPRSCKKATDNYALQADILIRLIHGDGKDSASEASN